MKRRARLAVALGGLVVVLLAAGLGFAAWREHERMRPRVLQLSERPIARIFINDRGDLVTVAEQFANATGALQTFDRRLGHKVSTVWQDDVLDVWTISDDGELVATGHFEPSPRKPQFFPNVVEVSSLRDGRRVSRFEPSSGAVEALVFAADGRSLVLDLDDGTLEVRDPATGSVVTEASSSASRMIDREGRDLLMRSGWLDGRSRGIPWRPRHGIEVDTVEEQEARILLSARPVLVTRRRAAWTLVVHELPSRRALQTLPLRGAASWSLVLSKDGDLAAVLSRTKDETASWVELFSLETGTLLRSWAFGAEGATALAFVPGEDVLAIGTSKGAVEFHPFKR